MQITNGREAHNIYWLDGGDMPIAAISAAWAATRRVKIRHGPSAACRRQTTDVSIRVPREPRRYHFVVDSRGTGSFAIYGTNNCLRRVLCSCKVAWRNFWSTCHHAKDD